MLFLLFMTLFLGFALFILAMGASGTTSEKKK